MPVIGSVNYHGEIESRLDWSLRAKSAQTKDTTGKQTCLFILSLEYHARTVGTGVRDIMHLAKEYAIHVSFWDSGATTRVWCWLRVSIQTLNACYLAFSGYGRRFEKEDLRACWSTNHTIAAGVCTEYPLSYLTFARLKTSLNRGREVIMIYSESLVLLSLRLRHNDYRKKDSGNKQSWNLRSLYCVWIGITEWYICKLDQVIDLYCGEVHVRTFTISQVNSLLHLWQGYLLAPTFPCRDTGSTTTILRESAAGKYY